jgi:ribosome-interacting GTPase 1
MASGGVDFDRSVRYIFTAMPANLTPQYYEAERRYRLARTSDERLQILQEMLAIMPKHKGSEKLQAELKTKISKLRKEEQKTRAQRRKYRGYHVEPEGAAQVVLIGPPNSGKSQLLAALTNATPEVAPYPFTTRKPSVGMMEYEDIKIQLVDTPPLTTESPEWWMTEIVRNSDFLLCVLDLGEDNLLEQTRTLIDRLEDMKICVLEEASEEGYLNKQLLMAANKVDLSGAEVQFDSLKEQYEAKLRIVSTSATDAAVVEEMRRIIFTALNIVRVYTKTPGKPADMRDPLILSRGSTVMDAARSIHKDFSRQLKYARVWGSNYYQGQRVERSYCLEDKDVIEFHI